MTTTPSDAALVRRFAATREEDAFVTLVRRHEPRVRRVCSRLLRDPRDVEDVLQTVFLVLACKADRVTWRESIAGWLVAVARRLALAARSDAARTRTRELCVSSLVHDGQDQASAVPETLHPVTLPPADLDLAELRAAVQNAMERLPEKYRTLVVLCDLEGETHQDAARALGWPVGSMSRRLDRARSLLRRELALRGIALALALAVVAPMAATSLRSQLESTHPAPKLSTRSPLPGHAQPAASLRRLLAQARLPESREFEKAARELINAAPALDRLNRSDDGQPDTSQGDEYRAIAALLTQPDPTAKTTVTAAQRLELACLRCHLAARD